jgi:hypothetical protein
MDGTAVGYSQGGEAGAAGLHGFSLRQTFRGSGPKYGSA